jgi:hypothetical protein
LEHDVIFEVMLPTFNHAPIFFIMLPPFRMFSVKNLGA